MRFSLAFSLSLLCACGDLSSVPGTAEPAGGKEDSLRSSGAATRIRVHYPAQSRVLALRGGSAPLSWDDDTQPTYQPDDTFVLDFTLAPGNSLDFKPVLWDSGTLAWAKGPNYTVKAGATVDVYPRFFTDDGRVSLLFDQFVSDVLAPSRDIYAYYPPSYDENPTATFPVLYMHDGQNLFDPDRAAFGTWGVADALDAGAQDGSIREIVVIAIDNTSDRMTEYTPTYDAGEGFGGNGGAYLRFITEELMPQVNRFVRVSHERAQTGILGSSLGGLISAWAGVHYGDIFGIVGALSPATWWDNDFLIGDVRDHTPAWPHRPDRVYVDNGTDDDDEENTANLAGTYLSIGYRDGFDFRHVVQQGASHSEYYWAQRFPGAMQFLFGGR
jgi:predicted alpha/beta superfamily hydrolase